jgi:predicted MFS family arabinose efflux permease
MTLLAWMILELTDSPWLVALVGFFGMAPMLLLGVLGGVLADRVDRRSLLITTQLASFAASLTLAGLLFTGEVRYWHGYLTVLVVGAAWALDQPSRRSVLHDLVGATRVTNAIALDSIGNYASRMIGPALAGVLITLVGVRGGYAAISMFYLAALILLYFVRLPAARSRGVGPLSIFRNMADGFLYVRRNNTIMAIVVITALMNLLLFPSLQVMVPVMARDVMRVGPGFMGTLLAAEALGALVGSVVIATRGTISYHGRIYLGGSGLACFMLLLFSLSHWYSVSLPMLLVLGLGSGAFGTMQAAIVVLVASDEMRGRALGVVALAIGSSPLGSLLVGGVATAVSPSFAVGLNASLGLGFLLLVGLLMPSILQRTEADRPQDETVGLD